MDESEDDNSAEESADEDGNIKVNFTHSKNKAKKSQQEKGIMGLKFMQRAEANKKAQLKE